MKDNLDKLVSRLGRLVDVLESKEFGKSVTETQTTVNRTVNLTEPSNENTSEYFSTGKDPISVDYADKELHRIGFGFVAKTVNIRSDIPLYVAFANPSNDGNFIPLGSSDLPFTIGGSEGIGSAYLWLRPQDPSKTAKVNVIAYR